MDTVKHCLKTKHQVNLAYILRQCFKSLILLALMAVSAHAQDQQIHRPWVKFRPYTPEIKEYALELGSMWEDENLYWLAANVGFHVGKCIFSESQSCQNYIDIIGGAGGRGRVHR